MDKTTYTSRMAEIDLGGKVDLETFDELIEFATKRKVRKPGADAVATPTGARAPKARAECAADGCDRTAMAKGLCSMHYTAERRKDPEVMEKAREASRRSVAKRKVAAESEGTAK